MKHALTALLICTPAFVWAAGSDDNTPPKTTATTTECKAPKIWDEKTKACVDAQESSLSDDQRYLAVRELAYAGALDRADAVLDSMDAQNSSRVQTYRGFIARKSGDFDGAMTFYAAALQIDPNNHLARSYMGQGLVKDGQFDAAADQLSEIRARGGRGTWAEHALNLALSSGKTFSY